MQANVYKITNHGKISIIISKKEKLYNNNNKKNINNKQYKSKETIAENIEIFSFSKKN